ncbi:IclR family transcriptional regulator [Paenarthrobacter sp. CM16]|uniref:IclR family transcriptional regulator n=1 Tax=Paenarthrobacter sp. CM16 TaxID=2738447 RepID=UPI001556AE07|nr:IclR family transcriptional regulator [Paenarthrobacter sp. CM16]NQD86437.1 IclR family transcriptional regulator [Paenarthrobacter sp. CM16]
MCSCESPEVNSRRIQGAQVVGRIAGLLRIIGRDPEGCSLSELVESSGLTRPTAYRLVTSLAAEGMLDQDERSGHWVLGPEIMLMGLVASARFPMEDVVRPSLRRLAAETSESVFFSVRRGTETVCLMREEGSLPLRSFVLHEGVRIPLGIGSAGIAILALLPQVEQDALLENWASHSDRYGLTHSVDLVRANIGAARQRGFSVDAEFVLEGNWGLGAAVVDLYGRPTWALSITGACARFRDEDRTQRMGCLLMEEARRISDHLRHAHRHQTLSRINPLPADFHRPSLNGAVH